ncbi:MAG TPA: hypothetical protein VG982_01975 [Candidatus Paceibacterota bacterium]|nr:hypothetical protein [Candidatus Paceibacterota bacterium]
MENEPATTKQEVDVETTDSREHMTVSPQGTLVVEKENRTALMAQYRDIKKDIEAIKKVQLMKNHYGVRKDSLPVELSKYADIPLEEKMDQERIIKKKLKHIPKRNLLKRLALFLHL